MRLLLVSLVFLLALLVVPLAHAGDIDVKPDSRIEVIYFTAPDCAYCRSWKLFTWKPFSDTPPAKHVTLITVDKGGLRYKIGKSDYPKEYRHLYEQEPSLGNRVPAFWVLVDGKPIVSSIGETSWGTTIEPAIIDLVTKKLAGGGTVSSLAP